ncbi:hypothetical protein [Nocardia sp. CA-120079]|uniref:hypothetical protein n=1 Tax=Nocardia sp. CA-120079 TaxID=3239974 RepID=UPI003D98F214
MPISFDTSGLQQLDSNAWRDPATGDIVQLSYFDLVPDLLAPLTDLTTLRRGLAEIHAESGCLSRARRWAAYTCPAARLDPNFAALPPF